MKKISLLMSAFFYGIVSQAQCVDYINIPDANFKTALVENIEINTDGDNEISCEEASAFTGTIDVSGSELAFGEITELTGIEYFVNLTRLQCNYNKLTSLDLSNNIALEFLLCSYNQLTSLDLSNNRLLRALVFSNNSVTTIDLSNNVDLQVLNCSDNDLISLDLSANVLLEAIYCHQNNLSSLNVSNGNNLNIIRNGFFAKGNPNLNCIQVDNADFSNANWSIGIDNGVTFNENCLEQSQQTQQTLSISDNEFSASFSIYPNPIIDNLNVVLETADELQQTQIYNLAGEEVLTSNQKTINANQLATGLYVVQVTNTKGEIGIARIMKK